MRRDRPYLPCVAFSSQTLDCWAVNHPGAPVLTPPRVSPHPYRPPLSAGVTMQDIFAQQVWESGGGMRAHEVHGLR